MAITITLYCPSNNTTRTGFGIKACDNHDKILQDIRAILRIKHAAVYDVNAKPLLNLANCIPGQAVMVAVRINEKVRRYSPRHCILHSGEESQDVCDTEDGYGLPWKQLDDSQKCGHILSLVATARKFHLRNTVRITRLYTAVQEDIQNLANVSRSYMTTDYDIATLACNTIFTNWAMKWELVLPDSLKPVDAIGCPAKVLATLAVLSSCTQGQARIMRTHLVEVVQGRVHSEARRGDVRDPVLQEEDVLLVINWIYQRAGSVAATIALAKEKKKTGEGKEKARKRQGIGLVEKTVCFEEIEEASRDTSCSFVSDNKT